MQVQETPRRGQENAQLSSVRQETNGNGTAKDGGLSPSGASQEGSQEQQLTAVAPLDAATDGQQVQRYETGQNGAEYSLTAKQQKVMPYLLSAPNVTQAAVTAGVSRTTIYRWLDDPIFRYELERWRGEAVREAKLALKGMLVQAVQALEPLLRSDDPRVRLGAARLALSFGFRVLEDQDINERLDLLENAVHLWKERNRRAF